jgi:hypothetical protein
MKTKREQLKECYDRLAELNEALTNMGPKKRGSDWEKTRVKHRDMVRQQIERLEDIPPVPSYSPGNDPLYEGLDDGDQAELEQPKAAPPARRGRCDQPTPEDEAWYIQAAARGAFEPLTAKHPAVHYPGKGVPPGRWARNIDNFEKRHPGRPLPGPRS